MKIYKVLLPLFCFLAILLKSHLGFALEPGKKKPNMPVHYMEIVTEKVGEVVVLYERFGLAFGAKIPEMGQARIATKADGTLIGIREPLAAHEDPIVRTYIEVEDVQQAVAIAEQLGAVVAYPPTRQGTWGLFAIVIHGNVQHGLWQP